MKKPAAKQPPEPMACGHVAEFQPLTRLRRSLLEFLFELQDQLADDALLGLDGCRRQGRRDRLPSTFIFAGKSRIARPHPRMSCSAPQCAVGGNAGRGDGEEQLIDRRDIEALLLKRRNVVERKLPLVVRDGEEPEATPADPCRTRPPPPTSTWPPSTAA